MLLDVLLTKFKQSFCLNFSVFFTMAMLRLTKPQFMSQPLAVFINNDREDDFIIAKNICSFFNDRDVAPPFGKYAAIVGEKNLKVIHCLWQKEGKSREMLDCRGKYIFVWKQPMSPPLIKIHAKSAVKSVVRGLILELNDVTKVRDTLDEVLGKYWSVVIGDEPITVFAHYHEYYLKNEHIHDQYWTVWRSPVG